MARAASASATTTACWDCFSSIFRLCGIAAGSSTGAGQQVFANDLETRLRKATLAETSPESLEATLKDYDAQNEHGALPHIVVATQVVDAVWRQFLSLLKPELDSCLETARRGQDAEAEDSCLETARRGQDAEAEDALSKTQRLLHRMELARATCPEEVAAATARVAKAKQEFEAEKERRASHEGARERLKHSLGSGNPGVLEEAMEHAQHCHRPEMEIFQASARLRELQTAERQLQNALESGDCVHLSTALGEAARQNLSTPAVDEARQKLQNAKTSPLVNAIKQQDYAALGRAIAEAENRDPEEIEEIRDVLMQAKAEYAKLDRVAKAVVSALGSLSHEDIRTAVDDAQRSSIVTEDVVKAEGVLSGMDHALENLSAAARRRPRDLVALQEGLHHARQQGLQAHLVYREAEEIFAGACTPLGMEWSIEELCLMWVVLCLRRPLQPAALGMAAAESGAGGVVVSHPFTVVVAELCHAASVFSESEPYPVQYIHHALVRVCSLRSALTGSAPPAGGAPVELQKALLAALDDLSDDPVDGLPGAGHHLDGQVEIGAEEFNNIGVVTRQAGLEAASLLLWWLVCVVEWDTGQRLLHAHMAEQAKRTADLINEAESTGRSIRTQLTALQATAAADAIGATAGGSGGESGSGPVGGQATALRAVLDEMDEVKGEAEKLQNNIAESKAPLGQARCSAEDVCRILELLRQARPTNLEEARSAVKVRQREASGRAREICRDTYAALEAKLLQLNYTGRQALEGEPVTSTAARTLGGPATEQDRWSAPASLPLATFSPRVETASWLQDHAFLQLLGVPEHNFHSSAGRAKGGGIDRCFQRAEIYERFGEKIAAVEDGFEQLCRAAVAEAWQRCGGRRLVAALKPLLVDLVKGRQRISSILNTLRECGLDKAERKLLRKHLQPRDLLLALMFSSMAPGPSQERMMSVAAKTDAPLPLLFGWAKPPSTSTLADETPPQSCTTSVGLQLCLQIHWAAFRELFCSPSHPLVLSIGSRNALGKSHLLQYLYALQETHVRGSTSSPLRIHAMPSIDIIGDFAREESLRGVTLADVHSYDPSEELCEALSATLASCAASLLLHVSLKQDLETGASPGASPGANPVESEDESTSSAAGATPRLSSEFAGLLAMIAAAVDWTPNGDEATAPRVILLLRDVDADEHGLAEQRCMYACVQAVVDALRKGSGSGNVSAFAWTVPPLAGLGPVELGNEVKSLRKSRALACNGSAMSGPSIILEDAPARAVRSPHKFPSVTVLQERCANFAQVLRQSREIGGHLPRLGVVPKLLLPKPSREHYGSFAQGIFRELESVGSYEGLLRALFPITLCHQQLASLSQERVRCLNRAREYMEPEERRRLEATAGSLDEQIGKLRRSRQQVSPHALLQTFAQLVLIGESNRIAQFGVYLDDWKQTRRAPLLEKKLRLRKQLDRLLEEAEEKTAKSGSRGSDAVDSRITDIRTELVTLQRRLDEVDVSTDSFWLELMLWHEIERTGARRGLKELDERLTVSVCKATYLSWVKSGSPVRFLHSAPLQFGAFEPLRWHPQISGASLFGSDFIGDVLRELDRDLGVDVRNRPLLVISVIGVQSSGKSTLMNYLFGCSFATHVGRCIKGLYISLLEMKRELVVILDTEGHLSVEAPDDAFDKQVALMTMACSDFVIVNNPGELGRHVGDQFQVCLFELYRLKLAEISPAIGFILQCLSMVNQQHHYQWVATVKKSLEEFVGELQQREKPDVSEPWPSWEVVDRKLSASMQSQCCGEAQDVQVVPTIAPSTSAVASTHVVFFDSESIFVMPSAFNDDVQFGPQVPRPTKLYALQALQLREKVFHWIGRAKNTQMQRLREAGVSLPPHAPDGGLPEAPHSSFASLSQWYAHARTVWQTLSMCGTDLLQLRTMRQVLMALQLQEFCDDLVQKHIDAKLSQESEALVDRFTGELRAATATSDVHAADNAFRGQLDALREAVLQEMHQEFDHFVKAHDTKFTDEQMKNDKRLWLMGSVRRKYDSMDSLWRSRVQGALERREPPPRTPPASPAPVRTVVGGVGARKEPDRTPEGSRRPSKSPASGEVTPLPLDDRCVDVTPLPSSRVDDDPGVTAAVLATALASGETEAERKSFALDTEAEGKLSSFSEAERKLSSLSCSAERDTQEAVVPVGSALAADDLVERASPPARSAHVLPPPLDIAEEERSASSGLPQQSKADALDLLVSDRRHGGPIPRASGATSAWLLKAMSAAPPAKFGIRWHEVQWLLKDGIYVKNPRYPGFSDRPPNQHANPQGRVDPQQAPHRSMFGFEDRRASQQANPQGGGDPQEAPQRVFGVARFRAAPRGHDRNQRRDLWNVELPSGEIEYVHPCRLEQYIDERREPPARNQRRDLWNVELPSGEMEYVHPCRLEQYIDEPREPPARQHQVQREGVPRAPPENRVVLNCDSVGFVFTQSATRAYTGRLKFSWDGVRI